MTIGGYLVLGCLFNPSLNHTAPLRIQNNSDSKVKKKEIKKEISTIKSLIREYCG